MADSLGHPVEAGVTVVSTECRGAVVLAVSGVLDVVSAPVLTRDVHTALSGHPERLVLDLTGVEFMASSGMSALIQSHDAATAAGTAMAVVAHGSATSRLIVLTGVDQIIALHPTVSDALTHLVGLQPRQAQP